MKPKTFTQNSNFVNNYLARESYEIETTNQAI